MFRLAAIFFLSFLMFILVSGNSIQAKTDTQSQTYKNLMGVGINSVHEWSDCDGVAKEFPAAGRVEEYSQVLADGWRHLSFVICAKDHFPNDVLDEKWVRTNVLQQSEDEMKERLIADGLNGNMEEINALENKVLRGKIKAAIVKAKRNK